MQLVFEVCDSGSDGAPARKVFEEVGGVVGRGTGCDWIIPDASRLLSSHHALVSYREGRYFLTDISSNGIGVSGSTQRLRKGQAYLINEGDVYQMGPVDIRARLVERGLQPGQRVIVDRGMIPDDAFLGLDPVYALDHAQQCEESCEDLTALNAVVEAAGAVSHGAVEREHLIVPRWREPAGDDAPAPPTPVTAADPEAFWARFGEALGMPLEALDTFEREALAIKVAGLFRQTVEGLRQSLLTRDELNSELIQGWTVPKRHTPLSECADTQAALAALLDASERGQSAEQSVAQAYREIHVHQLALVVACRAAVRGALAAFAPAHLLLCFERLDNPPRFPTDGAHWRAYQRHYQRLLDEQPLGEQLLRNDFSKAYDEQVRLVSTLHAAYPG
ncbi:type VI secretion system-associated FHA domain protein TagH [Pseudomonas sp. S1_E04]